MFMYGSVFNMLDLKIGHFDLRGIIIFSSSSYPKNVGYFSTHFSSENVVKFIFFALFSKDIIPDCVVLGIYRGLCRKNVATYFS